MVFRWEIKGDASMGSATNAILGCTMIWSVVRVKIDNNDDNLVRVKIESLKLSDLTTMIWSEFKLIIE